MTPKSKSLVLVFALLGIFLSFGLSRGTAAPAPSDLWARDNLVAWCIVPFDVKKRDPAARAAMLEKLQLHRLAYDWRAEHVATFDTEVEEMAKHHVEIVAWWFPTKLDENARKIFDVIARHQIRPQLWVSGGGEPVKSATEQQARIASEVKRIRPIVDEAARLGCQVGLYNHGGWFGEPENQLAVLAQLRANGATNVGLVYNFHHGHDHVGRFAWMWPQIQSSVLAVNLNGMAAVPGLKDAQKIVYLGDGQNEAGMMRIIQASGWRGLVGVLNHRTDVDAEVGLARNIAGLGKLAVAISK